MLPCYVFAFKCTLCDSDPLLLDNEAKMFNHNSCNWTRINKTNIFIICQPIGQEMQKKCLGNLKHECFC